MKIMKFGGSSVADAKNVNKVIDIITQALNKNENVIVVVSALGGITDELIKLATLALNKNVAYEVIFENICKRHNQIIEELINPKERKKVFLEISGKYNELEEIIKNIYNTNSLSEGISPRLLDLVVSFGEQLSSYLISEVIKNRGILCEFVDSRMIIKTDSNFGDANVDIQKSYELIAEHFKNKDTLYVMGGFIASTEEGITTTLGRGGSDYTAALVGAALNFSTIEIWTDVDGLMTADPRKVKDASVIPEISYKEAEKMAYLGAKVIHPKTIKPAELKDVTIFIKNTFNPGAFGTKISNQNVK